MLYVKDQYATVWKIENKGNYSEVSLSTSRKDKATGDYKNSNWSFVRFVGDAQAKIDLLSRQTRIVIKGMGISLEPYMNKDGEKAYPKNPQFVVFNFELQEDSGSRGVMDTAPQVEEEGGSEDIPF